MRVIMQVLEGGRLVRSSRALSISMSGSEVTEGARGMEVFDITVRAMAKTRAAGEGARVVSFPNVVRNQEHVLDITEFLARFLVSGLEHSVRSVGSLKED